MKTALITLRLRMDTAGGVTAPESTTGPDNTLVLRRDTTGAPHLPGTTVAGSLRALCRDHNTLCATEQRDDLFGGISEDNERTASPIQVLGTVYRTGGDSTTHTRTAVNRWRAGADTNTLHSIELLPAGTEFDIHLRWDNPDPQRYPVFVEALRSWRPNLGRGASHAAGSCTVIGLGEHTYDLATPDGLTAWLHLTTPDTYPAPREIDEPKQYAPSPVVHVGMEIVDGLHIGAPSSPDDSDISNNVNLVLRRDGQLFIPASTLKGILRSRAEYICRVVGAGACTTQQCGQCRPCQLFGFGGQQRHARRAKIAIHDTAITEPTLQQRQHVALDRFTGGYADGHLYADEVVTRGHFTLRIDDLETATSDNRLTEADQLLLHAVLTDLHDGLIGIGARTTSGLGTVRITSPDWQRPDLTQLATQLTQETAA